MFESRTRLNSSTRQRIRLSLAAALLASTTLTANLQAGPFFPFWRNLYEQNVGRAQFARSTAIDKRGNVIVCGTVVNQNAKETFFVDKYDALTGASVWPQPFTFNAPNGGAAYGTAVAVDGNGEIYATGYYDTANGHDYLTFRINAKTGAAAWTTVNGIAGRTYNNPAANGADEALEIAVDSIGNPIVTGRSVGAGYDIYTIKYDTNGALQAQFRYTSAQTRDDVPYAIAVDSGNNVVIAGLASRFGNDSFVVLKYNLTTNTLAWPPAATNYTNTYGATGLALTSNNEIIVTGPENAGDGTYNIRTLKFNADGSAAWPNPPSEPTLTSDNRRCRVAVNKDGQASVIGTSSFGLTKSGTRINVVKYDTDGTRLWSEFSPAPANFPDDIARDVIIDGTSNTIVVGESEPADTVTSGLYVGRFDPDGKQFAPIRFDDLEAKFAEVRGDNTYYPRLAIDPFGGVVLVANFNKPRFTDNNFYVGLSALKFSRFILETGDPVTGTGVPANAKITALNPAALSETGMVAARATVGTAKTKLAAIVTQNVIGDPSVPAVQAGDVPGVSGAKFKSFLDPVVYFGRIAFIGKISGVPASESSGVWTTLFNGSLQPALQQGKQVPGMAAGILVKSISGISIRGNQLVTTLKVAGPGVTTANSSVLLSQVATAGNATVLLRTNSEDFVVSPGGTDAQIKSFTVLSASKTSPGQGRWQATGRVLALLTLTDKRTVLASITSAGTISSLYYTGQAADSIVSGAKWKTFGLPCGEDVGGTKYTVAAGSLQPGSGVTSGSDMSLFYSNGATTLKLAAEGGDVPGLMGAKFASFSDPVVNTGSSIAFLASMKGTGVSGANKNALFFGFPLQYSILARQGDDAPTVGDDQPKYKSFTSFVLPNTLGGYPVFTAKVAGKGVNAKNNNGVFTRDTYNLYRSLVRTGDFLDGRAVLGFKVLQALPGTAGTPRSYNASGAVATYVNLKGGGQAVYVIGIP